jgi:hypothetical protein
MEAIEPVSGAAKLPVVQWFSRSENGKGPQQQMFEDADAAGRSVFVAQDSGFGNASKEYASLQSHEELAEILMSSQDQECCMYELIREGRPCKLYLDLEWESEKMVAADAHRVLTNVVAKLHAFLQVTRSMPSSRRLHAQKQSCFSSASRSPPLQTLPAFF